MEYKTIEDLRDVAEVRVAERALMTRREKLERWAELLERDPTRRLRSLGEIELKAPAERALMRSPDSPLTVAFEDPVLREQGLVSDRLGDGMAFFEITEDDAHQLMCSCMNGWSMTSSKVARGVRRLANPRTGLIAAAWMGACAIVALPALALLVH
jgi:hypothetical protein